MNISDYLRLSIKDLHRMGYLLQNSFVRGEIKWTVGDRFRASVGAATDTRGVPVLKLAYIANGEPRDVVVYLRWKQSNLKPDTEHGYYYFVCPATGKLCRILYLVNGEFVSRQAFRPLYPQQERSHTRRNNALYGYLDALDAAEKIDNAKYRRETYRGKQTPWGRKVERVYNRYAFYRDAFAKENRT